MTWDTAGAVTVATLGVVAGGLQYVRSRDDRSGIKRDLEILALLPPGSEAHRVLTRHVETQVVRTVRIRDGARRNPGGVRLALLWMVLGSVNLATGFRSSGAVRGGLAAMGAVALMAGTYGVVESIPKRLRDARGNPIKEEPG